MRICEIGTGSLPISPHVAGGVEKYVHYLSTELQNLGHDVTVLDILDDARRQTNYTVAEVLPCFANARAFPGRTARGLLFSYAAMRRLEKFVKEGRFDIVNFHSQFAAFFALDMVRRTGAASAFTLHNPVWSSKQSFSSPWNRIRFCMERSAETSADLVIFLSNAVASNVVEHLELEKSRFGIVPVGVDDAWFEEPQIDPQITQKYAPRGEHIILNVGRIAKYKNQSTIVKALPRILEEEGNVMLILVGPIDSIEYHDSLKRTIAELGLESHVLITGEIPLIELRELMNAADIFVIPSLMENMPQAGLEAIAAGKPIVYSNIDSMTEHFTTSIGIPVEPEDPIGLSSAVIQLMGDAFYRAKLGLNARRHARENYRWPMIGSRVASLYADCLSRMSKVQS